MKKIWKEIIRDLQKKSINNKVLIQIMNAICGIISKYFNKQVGFTVDTQTPATKQTIHQQGRIGIHFMLRDYLAAE